MKKIAFALLILFFLLIPAFTVCADVVTESENDFFSRYSNECVYLGRRFYVNGADGFVTVKEDPGSNNGGAQIKNGETVYLEYSCLYNGEYWGLEQNGKGWIKISGQLLALYDYVAFEEEHLDEFYTYSGNYDEIKETKAALAWPWPGASAPLWTIEDIDTKNFKAMYAYKDAHGREWGFVTYLFGSPNIWFCLSDPLNRDMPAFNPAPEPMVWKSDTVHIDIVNTANPSIAFIIILVAALVIGTVILIKVIWKQNGGKHDV